MTGFGIGQDGTIRGKFSDGTSRDLGQIQVARFANPSGLRRRGQNQFAAGPNSGLPVVNSPGAGGSASITAGATELSNTDIGRNLVDLVLARTQFRASAQVVSTADQLFNDLANLRR